ncbi:MAG: cation:proton antiporter [Phycisphaerae bacterium]|nr:cation:proton antiporter [Phycisphaerae bacterium]
MRADAVLILASGEPARGLVLDILIILGAASLVTTVLRRLGLGSIPGFLLLGALIGPSALGLISDQATVDSLSGLATILLLFTIGLHLDIGSVRHGLRAILGTGLVSTLASALLCWPAAMLFGLSAPAALAASMALSMSSTAVVLRLLQDRREIHQLHGRLCVGVSIMQDLLSIAFLAALPLLAQWGGEGLRGSMADAASAAPGKGVLGLITAAGVGLGGIAALIVLARLLVPKLLAEAARGASGEGMLIVASAVALGAAVLTAYLGFSPELGAFLAGFILASTPFKYQLAGQLAPMRDLFMAVFFTAVGLKMNVGESVAAWYVVIPAVLYVTVVKAAAIGVCAWGFGASGPTSALTAAGLANAGEFTLILVSGAAAAGLLAGREQAVLIAVVVGSLIAAPGVYLLGVRAAGPLARVPAAPWARLSALRSAVARPDGTGAPGVTAVSGHVIIAGYGLVGRSVADRLEVEGIPYAVVDLNPSTIETQRRLGRSVHYGDISNPEVLESAGVRTADAVIVTFPDDEAVLRACRAVRSIAPEVFIAVRTSFLSNAFVASSLGADHATVAEVAMAEAMSKQVIEQITRRAQRKRG